MTDFSHLDALETRLRNEQGRLSTETNEAAINLRKVWITQTKKEIASERELLGLNDDVPTDDELLKALG